MIIKKLDLKKGVRMQVWPSAPPYPASPPTSSSETLPSNSLSELDSWLVLFMSAPKQTVQPRSMVIPQVSKTCSQRLNNCELAEPFCLSPPG